jgi:hypothetical protein
MIYTVIADIKNFNADKFLEKCVSGKDFFKIEKCRITPLPSSVYASPSISAELLDHIRSVSNERLRKERCGAYLLLSAVVKNMLGFVPEVKFSQNGKPFFEREFGIYLNGFIKAAKKKRIAKEPLFRESCLINFLNELGIK